VAARTVGAAVLMEESGSGLVVASSRGVGLAPVVVAASVRTVVVVVVGSRPVTSGVAIGVVGSGAAAVGVVLAPSREEG
jgi:hypothetical protein